MLRASESNDSEEATLFHEGIELFNDGEWFEAHETWEDIWHLATGSRKRFYQGLIQCAVTIEHVRRGNPRGVRAVWKSARPKFDGLPDVCMGIHIPRLLAAMEAMIRPVLDLPADWFDPARPRGEELPVRWDDAPRIELEYDPFSGHARRPDE